VKRKKRGGKMSNIGAEKKKERGVGEGKDKRECENN
jgi:hypothetical protein